MRPRNRVAPALALAFLGIPPGMINGCDREVAGEVAILSGVYLGDVVSAR